MKPPVLETERLRLRPFAPADARPCSAWPGAREIADTTRQIPTPTPTAMAEAWIATHAALHAQGRALTLAVEIRKERRALRRDRPADRARGQTRRARVLDRRPRLGPRTLPRRRRAPSSSTGFGLLGLHRIWAAHFRAQPRLGPGDGEARDGRGRGACAGTCASGASSRTSSCSPSCAPNGKIGVEGNALGPDAGRAPGRREPSWAKGTSGRSEARSTEGPTGSGGAGRRRPRARRTRARRAEGARRARPERALSVRRFRPGPVDLDRARVDLARRPPGLARELPGELALVAPRGERCLDPPVEREGRHGRLPRAVSFDDHGDFAAGRAPLAKKRRELRQRPARRLLVELRQLSGHTRPAGPRTRAASSRDSRRRCGASNQTSVSSRSRSLSRNRRRSARARRQKAHEQVGHGGQARDGERRRRRGRPGQDRARGYPASAAASTRRSPGSETSGIPASETSATCLARPEAAEKLLDPLRFARRRGTRSAGRAGRSARRASP